MFLLHDIDPGCAGLELEELWDRIMDGWDWEGSQTSSRSLGRDTFHGAGCSTRTFHGVIWSVTGWNPVLALSLERAVQDALGHWDTQLRRSRLAGSNPS